MGRTYKALRALGSWALLAITLAACTGTVDPGANTDLSATTGAPTASLSAASNVVASGAATTLTWGSTKATSCTAASGWSGTLATSGSQSTGPVTSNTTYSITCSGTGGTSNAASVTVNVVPTASLSANPLAVPSGGTSTLSWSSTNATGCTASGGWSGALATSGSQSTGPVTSSTTFSISCTGPGGASALASQSITILASPTVSLLANPLAVSSGGTSTLSWSSTNATSCTASGGWSGALASSGTQGTGALSNTTSYSLSCVGAGGTSAPVSTTVTVTSGSMTIAPSVAALTLSQSQQFTVTVPGGGGASWTVDGVSGGNSSVGLVNSAGLYTPGTATGTHTLIATSNANSTQSASAQVYVTDLSGVLTYHNDLARDGANTHEFALSPSNLTTASFGKLFSCSVDGAVYAQPLWVAGLVINGSTHNVVFVATAHDGLYAFDADASPCAQLWSVSLIDTQHGANSGETTVPSGTSGNLVGAGDGDITPEVGVIGTPVIDASNAANPILYVVSKSVSADHSTFYQRLHAINALTGQERSGSPVNIAATFAGQGVTMTTFSSRQENQRPGLALLNGTVYIAWASHEDTGPFYGWVIGYSYNGSTFGAPVVFNATPNVGFGGIWMGGGAPASDGSYLYLLTGNGGFDANSAPAPKDYGDSLLQLDSSLTVNQYFTPSDEATDQSEDKDFGSGGTAVLADLPTSPVIHLLLGGGKDGSLYVINRDNFGGYGDSNAVQKINTGHGMFMTGAYWNFEYYFAGTGPLNAYQLNPAVPDLTLSGSSSNSFHFPGATPSVSADGTQSGIVWALDNHLYCTNQSSGCGPAVLHAYDATNVTSELWNSSMVAGDAAGNAVKFTVPTVANGHLYVGTRGNNTGGVYGSTSVSGELDVYGLKPN